MWPGMGNWEWILSKAKHRGHSTFHHACHLALGYVTLQALVLFIKIAVLIYIYIQL